MTIIMDGFALSKQDCQEFRDGICLRYGWTPARIPSYCSCGLEADVTHSLSCPLGGYPSIRHNDIRDTTAALLNTVCHNVSTEPMLQPLTGENLRYKSAILEDHAPLDVAASSLWGSRKYEERVREVERATCVPAAMSACGSLGKAASALFKRIAALIAEKKA